MDNIAIISLGTGGTMGHMSLTTTLAKTLSASRKKVFLFSEVDYHIYSKNSEKIKYITISEQEHKETFGGKLHYEHHDALCKEILKLNIDAIVFSTFFDPAILTFAKNNNIKTMLISYPLRDSHREVFKARRYHEHFDRIIILNDLFDVGEILENETVASPIKEKKMKTRRIEKVNKILITLGGGGRPSSERFVILLEELFEFSQIQKDVEFLIIQGNANSLLKNRKNVNIIKWSNDFEKLIDENDLVISEAGYFTMVDLISKYQPSILIPGARRIDNQELRAIEFEKRNIGKVFFPEEDSKKFIRMVEDLVCNPAKINHMKANFRETEQFLFNRISLDKAVLEWLK